jgi:hypothetical protein
MQKKKVAASTKRAYTNHGSRPKCNGANKTDHKKNKKDTILTKELDSLLISATS